MPAFNFREQRPSPLFAKANLPKRENPRFREIKGISVLDFLKHIGERIRARILRSGYPSIELYAHENHIPKSTLSEIISGKNDPRLSTLAKICAGLDITLSELFHDPAVESWVRESAPKYVARRPTPSKQGVKTKREKKT